MKIDIGFWDKDGNYKEDIQEVEMLSVKELNEIELIKAQNTGLKAQNDSLQETLNKLKVKLNEFADKFDCLYDYTDVLEVRSEDENGYYMGEETAIWGTGLDDLETLLRDFIEFVEAIK
jgi:hypothetical protein